MGAVLEVVDVTKAFGGIRAVDHVSLTVEEGQIHGLIGPNGSGKSTLMNVISGRYPANSGRITLDGQDLSGKQAHVRAATGIGRTFQHPKVLPDMTFLENVLLGSHNLGKHGLASALLGKIATRKEESSLIAESEEALDFVGLSERATVLGKQVTTGEARLLGLARALVAKPRVLLLDEPGAGLNASETNHLRERLLDLRGRGLGVLLVDHDMSLVMGVVDQVLVLNQGRPIAKGSAAVVQRDPAVLEAYLGRRAASTSERRPADA